MNTYPVKKLAKLAGVSVRTLHLYDEIGLLKPAVRTEARYRFYGEEELLRLQQILFYKELGFSLQEIGELLDDPEFDLCGALENHKAALLERRLRVDAMLKTIDKTIQHLKEKNMLQPEELYEGLPKETAEAWRKEALAKYGEEATHAENTLRKMSKEEITKLKAEQETISRSLLALMNEDPASEKVQQTIALHYANIRAFWGTTHSPDAQGEAYAGLGKLYTEDERFTKVDGKSQPGFAAFLQKAMAHFTETKLK